MVESPRDRLAAMTLDECADYIITKVSDDGSLSLLKLHKLVYYAQAWHLALYDRPLFDGKFEAWVHGPVSRPLYKRFVGEKLLYSPISRKDRYPWFKIEGLDQTACAHIDEVLEVYAGLSGTQLEIMTHEEDPWIRARGGVAPAERCETEIDEGEMRKYYRSRLRTA